jgi:hypothetical protein
MPDSSEYQTTSGRISMNKAGQFMEFAVSQRLGLATARTNHTQKQYNLRANYEKHQIENKRVDNSCVRGRHRGLQRLQTRVRSE